MEFEKRYKTLNARQQQAVDTIDGPLLVLAGPGTGKTELLSMRAANILKQTDTLPNSILCLTFTESGASAMRERLRQIIGADAYKVTIHTFHSFGSEIINRHREYFYHGADVRPADELLQHEILSNIFGELDYTNPLATTLNGNYTHLRDAMTVISELKGSGLSSDELRAVLNANESALDSIEREVSNIFANRVSKSTAHLLAPLAEIAASAPQPTLPAGITPLTNVLALSIAHAIDQAIEDNSTKPITAWKNTWCEKDENGTVVFRDRRRQAKLRALAPIYYEYSLRMEQAGLYDYDDMILNVIHAVETNNALRANLREQYLYIMVDEFQDTNLAQLRLLFNLTENESSNVMAVGDDDQAIYSFQGADLSNIHSFRRQYNDPTIIPLIDNYRSAPAVLEVARHVITQGEDRMENTIDDLSKELTPHRPADKSQVLYQTYSSRAAERQAIAEAVAGQIKSGVAPRDIAIMARRHNELVDLLPYLAAAGVAVNYERRDNAIEHPLVIVIEQLLSTIHALHSNKHDIADSQLPRIIAHPAFGYSPSDIYRLSLKAWRDRTTWLDVMQSMPVFKPFADWLLARESASATEPLERQIDAVIGSIEVEEGTEDQYKSPLYDYFFSEQARQTSPDVYLSALEALRTIRDRVREHYQSSSPGIAEFLDFIELHRSLGTSLMTVRHRANSLEGHVNLMTVHKAKGLEFNHVYLTGMIDSAWGERVRSRSRLIGYPANLALAPAGDSYDERIRLAYVALTRARQTLTISLATDEATNRPQLPASFLTGLSIAPDHLDSADDIAQLETIAELDWRGHLVRPMTSDMQQLLAPILEQYKLSATHLGNFLDVSRGGPDHFLLSNLLRFPSAKSANAEYGTAMHATLQRAHDHIRATGERRAIEDIIGDFERLLAEGHLSPSDQDQYLRRGIDALGAFLDAKYSSFNEQQSTELNLGNQGIQLGEAKLAGKLDLVDIDPTNKTIRVTDYKTGKASRDWKGSTDYAKMSLHRYRQQLMFYQLLVQNSRDYSQYDFSGGVLQFVEPAPNGDILALEQSFSDEELSEFTELIQAVWRAIMALDMPDVSNYPANIDGIRQFEADLIDKYSNN